MTIEIMAYTDVDPPGSTGLVNDVVDISTAMSVAEILEAIVRLAWRAFGADAAGILLVGDAGVASTAASGAEARLADCIQVDHQQGPGLEAIRGRQPILWPDLRVSSRWRFWAPRAADLGFCSVLSLPLINGSSFGAVTLYSDRPSNFDVGVIAPGLEFAHQASLAITEAVEREKGHRPPAFQKSLVRHKVAS